MEAEVFNAKQVASALRRLPSDPELTRALRQANKEVAELFVEPIKKRIPVGKKPKTGRRLRDTVKATGARTLAKIKIGGKKQYYAWMRHRGYHPGGGSKEVKGIPFAREGVSKTYKKALKLYPQKLEPVIKKFNRKYGPIEGYLRRRRYGNGWNTNYNRNPGPYEEIR